MARVKVRLADNIARVVFIEDAATIGATLGTNLFLPDGEVATPETLAEWLGVSASGGGVTNHRLLQGLALGNDHPQYTRRDTLTTPGDIYVRGASTVQRLGIGAADSFLRVVAGAPAWGTIVAGDNVTLTELGGGVLSISAQGGGGDVHDEPLTDGNSNFIFAGGDIVVVVGVPNP